MHLRILFALALSSAGLVATAQAPRQMVQQAVDTEIAADRADHSHWLYLERDTTPDRDIKQWVCETDEGDVKRIFWRDGTPVPPNEQRSAIDGFIHDSAARVKQRKAGHSDSQQSEQMMRLLPGAFIWTEKSHTGESTTLHFEPDPNYHPPSYAARVFAAMAGDMTIDNGQHRIVALDGHLIRDVLFGGGLFGRMEKGGNFSLQRQQVAPGQWQITATHVHVKGHVLMFKTISEQEDDLKAEYQLQPPSITLQQASALVLSKPE